MKIHKNELPVVCAGGSFDLRHSSVPRPGAASTSKPTKSWPKVRFKPKAFVGA